MTSVAISLDVLRKYEVGMPRLKGEQKNECRSILGHSLT